MTQSASFLQSALSLLFSLELILFLSNPIHSTFFCFPPHLDSSSRQNSESRLLGVPCRSRTVAHTHTELKSSSDSLGFLFPLAGPQTIQKAHASKQARVATTTFQHNKVSCPISPHLVRGSLAGGLDDRLLASTRRLIHTRFSHTQSYNITPMADWAQTQQQQQQQQQQEPPPLPLFEEGPSSHDGNNNNSQHELLTSTTSKGPPHIVPSSVVQNLAPEEDEEGQQQQPPCWSTPATYALSALPPTPLPLPLSSSFAQPALSHQYHHNHRRTGLESVRWPIALSVYLSIALCVLGRLI